MGRRHMRASAFLLLGLFLMATLPPQVAATAIEFEAEQRVNTLNLAADETYAASIVVAQYKYDGKRRL